MDIYAAQLQAEKDRLEGVLPPLSPVLCDEGILESIFAQLPLETLLSLSLVSRTFRQAATAELFQDLHLDSALSVQRFQTLLETTDVGRRVRGIQITKSTLEIFDLLPVVFPNLQKLTFASTARVPAATLVDVLPRFPRLRHVVLVGQDVRSRRRRLSEVEPEGDVGKALRELADPERGSGLRLRSLTILATPVKLSSLDRFLEAHGRDLETLCIESCGIGGGLTTVVEQWCPSLKTCRLDSLSSARAPPSTPRPETDLAPTFDGSLPLGFPIVLTSLHLSSLPSSSPTIFALFASPSHASLQSLSFAHCDISAAHLSFFAFVTRLRLVACTDVRSIPVYPRGGRTDVGPGCKELRQVNLLGCSGLSLGNLWELSVLGREELSLEEEAERKKLGLGKRGLRKITVDGAEGKERLYTVGGLFFTLPLSLASSSSPIPVPSALPPSLSPPAHLVPYLETNVLSPSLPSPALLQTLLIAQDLEEVRLFGLINASSTSTSPSPPLARLSKLLPHLRSALAYVPLLGPYLLSLSETTSVTSTPRLPSYPHPEWPPFHQLRVAACTSKAGQPIAKLLAGLPWPVVETGGQQGVGGESGKRLSRDEVEWLVKASGGRLGKVYV